MASTRPRVLAVLVATDGAVWLPEVLSALEQQTYRNLDVVAIDNGSRDGSRDVLLSRLSEDRILVSERDLGFAGAVSMALDARPDADLVLLLHDDVALAPDAVGELVAAIAADPRLAIVGPKLVDWDDPSLLLNVGWTVDVTGRAEFGLEPDERDQGQRDEARRPLVVSTAGMLIRRDVFDALGGFDRRYHLFRDDLDLCWRAWLAGWEVEMVPAASARHRRAAAGYHRLGQTALLGPRYFAERNTLATLLKNYGVSRLVLVLPLFLVVGLAKVLGFIATRRLGDAWQTVRAWAWNVVHLRRTLQLRGAVQSTRRRTDVEVRDRFERIGPRVRAYVEAIADRVTGGDLAVESIVDSSAEPQTVTARVITAVRRRPVLMVGAVLVLVGLVVSLPLLPGGDLRGGELAPFPTSSRAALEDYVASWHDAGAFGTAAAPSPAQAVLGLLQWVSLGSAYLASRLLVLGAIPMAWLLALRAVRPLAPTVGPRVAAATVYALSPTALAAVRGGQVGALVLLVALPALASSLFGSLRPDAEPASAWRASAAAVLVGGLAIAFEPSAVLVLAAVLLVSAVVVAIQTPAGRERRRRMLRIGAMAFGVLAVLFPWSLTLFRFDGPITGTSRRVGADAEPLWRWLLQAPEAFGFAGVLAGAGAVLAGVFGLVFAIRRRGEVAIGLWLVALLGAGMATATSRAGADAWTWPGAPLLLTAAAFAGLFAVGLRSVAGQLAEHDFGWRQVGAGLMVIGAVMGVGVGVVDLVEDGWTTYAVAVDPLPPFVVVDPASAQADETRSDEQTLPDADPADTAATADAAEDAALAQPYRILVVADDDGVVAWDLVDESGPSMASYGTPLPDGLIDTVDAAIADVVGGSDPGAAGRLGLLNVRYLVVPEGGRSDALERSLASQLDLEPRNVATGLVYEVSAFLPRVVWMPEPTADAIAARGTPPATASVRALQPVGGSIWAGDVPGRGAVLVSETEPNGWEVRTSTGVEREARSSAGLVRVDVPDGTESVVVEHRRQGRRTAAVAVQVLAVLLVGSILLRPPGFATEREA